MDFKINHFDTIDSTNTYLYELGRNGAEEGTVVISDYQSAGRGRSGRCFESPNGNLYMSLLIRPEIKADMLHLLTPMCAVCVVNAIYDVLKIKCYIKWVNDIYYNNKKVCGILTELGMKSDIVDFAVIGIGINVFYREFEGELIKTAGSLLNMSESANYLNKDELTDSLSKAILINFDRLYKAYNIHDFMNDYRCYSFVIGRKVTYYTESESKEVTVIDISDDGSLVVKDIEGNIKSYSDGEIRIKI